MHERLWQIVRTLNTDYEPFGKGEREAPDCSGGCCCERTYTTDIPAHLQRIVWLLALAVPSWGQVTISSIQSSLVGSNSPNNVQGITSGAQLPGNGFTL